MKGKKLIIILILINIISIGIIYNFIKKEYFNNKLILKAMTEAEYENNITALNQSHTDYANYIQGTKAQIASAITDMGVSTSSDASAETMSSNIRSIARDASSIAYDNTSSGLTSTNVQGAVDELSESSEWQFIGELRGYNSYSDDFTKYQELFLVCSLLNAGTFFQQIPSIILGDTTSAYNVTAFYGTYGASAFSISLSKTSLSIHAAMTNNADVKSGSAIKIYAK